MVLITPSMTLVALSFPGGHTVKLNGSVDTHFWGEVGSFQSLSPPTIFYTAAHFCPSASASIDLFRVAITDPPIRVVITDPPRPPPARCLQFSVTLLYSSILSQPHYYLQLSILLHIFIWLFSPLGCKRHKGSNHVSFVQYYLNRAQDNVWHIVAAQHILSEQMNFMLEFK